MDLVYLADTMATPDGHVAVTAISIGLGTWLLYLLGRAYKHMTGRVHTCPSKAGCRACEKD